MNKNVKTLLFLLSIVGIGLFLTSTHDKTIKRSRERFWEVSENFSPIYGRNMFKVYGKIDSAARISEKLEEFVKADAKELDFSQYKKWPVVSLWVDPDDLYGQERGIIVNGQKRGRLWERAAYLTYHREGEQVFSSYVGLRLHGNASRRPRATNRSFRVYFRKELGETKFLAGEKVTLRPGAPAEVMVLRNDGKYNFAHDFGFSLLNRIGGLAPNITPIILYINGKFYDYQFISEHIAEDQIKHYYGHNDFLVYKFKKESNRTTAHLLYEDAIERVRSSSTPIKLDEVKKIFDIENLTAGMLLVLFTGMTDWAQGVVFKDLSGQNDPWKWLVWDYDNAFFIDRERIKKDVQHPWEIDSFHVAMDQHRGILQTKIFNRLLAESPEYREYFKQKVDDLFDRALSPTWLAEKFSMYREFTVEAGSEARLVSSLERIENFVKNRKPVFCKQMLERLGEQASTCQDSKR